MRIIRTRVRSLRTPVRKARTTARALRLQVRILCPQVCVSRMRVPKTRAAVRNARAAAQKPGTAGRRFGTSARIDRTGDVVHTSLLMLRPSLLLLCLLVWLSGCKKNSSPANAGAPAESTSNAWKTIEACSLLTREEVAAVQGSPITDTKSSETSDGAHVISLCYYAATELSKSVSLALTKIDSKRPNAPNPRTSWEQTFGRFEKVGEPGEEKDEKAAGAKGRGEEEEEKAPPEKIEGVGDEAFWAGNRFGGALYVLKGDCSLRISVGGPGDQKSKLEKSKALAKKAVANLPK